jgi:hypothetical protein
VQVLRWPAFQPNVLERALTMREPGPLLVSRLVGIVQRQAELVEFDLVQLEFVVLGLLVLVGCVGIQELTQVVLFDALLGSRARTVPLLGI